VGAILVEGPNTFLEENHPMTISSKFSSYWANGFRQEDFYVNFPVSYVKLGSAVAAILVGGLKCRTQFWEETTQGSFQQRLVEIGSVVSDFLKISSPLFSIFSLAAILVGNRDHRTQFGRGPPKDHSTKVWLQLAQWFLRRLKCEMLMDGRRTKSDGHSSHGLKARWAKKYKSTNNIYKTYT
jgi:hypothetical protein